ncbi:MBL fold metallo-hydrolase [Bacterioplanoides sp.]|uniref:MBL fold metallo-hydrolase n=1 Tax=Bacterioplanoides sp. TaxID=2066072 RepID=UPI003B5C2C83
MKQLRPDLWQTSCYQSGMLSSHAYYLQTEQGNLLIYNTADPSELEQITALGGIDAQLVTHRDEATPSLARIQQQFQSRLFCSEKELVSVAKYARAEVVTEADSGDFYGIQILATPGHTDGSLCFYYESPFGDHYLFTGDTIFLWNGQWSTLVVSSAGGSAEDLKTSLKQLRDLRPQLVMSSGFVGDQGLAEMKSDDWPAVVDAAIEQLER